MSSIDRRTIAELAATAGQPLLVSLYLPAERTGREIRQGPIRLKNLLRDAQAQLRERGLTDRDAQELLAPAGSLLESSAFWEQQLDGLAVFLGPDGMREFRCPRRFDEFCYVHDHFHLKPLLPLLRNEASFHLLTLSLNEVRLYEATADTLAEVDREPVPASLTDALGTELDEPTLQHHAGNRPGTPGSGAIYHGQGAGEDDREQDVLRFLRRVDAALQERLPENGQPVVLAGVESLLAKFRKLSQRASLVPEGVTGNPESFTAAELREQAWRCARPVLERDADAAAARFAELRGTDRAATRLKEIGPALATGRVESLLVAVDRRIWGVMGEDGVLEVHREPRTGDVDLLDRLAVLGLDRGAEVVARRAARLPDGAAAAAVLRY